MGTGEPIGIVGGTGRLGRALAGRWAAAGLQVLISGLDDAVKVAAELNVLLPPGAVGIIGDDVPHVVRAAKTVVTTVPYEALDEVCDSLTPVLQGKLVLSPIVPLHRPALGTAWRPAAGSAAQQLQQALGASGRVVAALHTVSYEVLLDEETLPFHTFVCGDSGDDKALVIELCKVIGLRCLDAGPLENASVLEGMTAVLIGINRQIGSNRAGLRITGV